MRNVPENEISVTKKTVPVAIGAASAGGPNKGFDQLQMGNPKL